MANTNGADRHAESDVREGRSWNEDVRMLFFFFQAEDGIRGIGVTGVQTCALPIYHHSALAEATFGVLDRAIGSIPAHGRGEPEGLFEEAQGGSGVSIAEVGIDRRRHAATSFWASGTGRAAGHVHSVAQGSDFEESVLEQWSVAVAQDEYPSRDYLRVEIGRASCRERV